jgi:outer membrane protein assembly factor BamB
MRNVTAFLASAVITAGLAHAQFGRGGAEWTTSAADAQRSSWIRTDAKISKDSVQKPGFQFLWKVKFNNDPRELNALTPASLMNSYIGYRGFRSISYTGGSSNNIFAVDTDLGRLEWQKQLAVSVQPPAPTWACPGGMTANLTRPTGLAFPGEGPAGRGGRGSAAKSGVGPANEGAATLAEIAAATAARGGGGGRNFAPPAPAPAAPGRGPDAGRGGRAGGGGGGFGRQASYVYALSSDGMLHAMYVSNGEEPEIPTTFIPANANAHGLIVTDGFAYVATTAGCGSAPSGVWALELASKAVTSWKSASGSVAGSTGAAINSDGTLYVATEGGEVVSLEAKTLAPKDVYKGGPGFTSSPVIFQHKDKTLVAALAKDGSVHILDTASLKTPLVKTAANPAAANLPPTALSSWQDSAGTRYILAPGNTTVVAWKVADEGGSLSLQPAWTSREMVAPLTPMIINGVAFAVSSGEFRSPDASITAAQRAQRSVPAVLYALDGATGKELWSSGKTITSFVHGGGLAGGASQLYLGTYDGTFWAFGVWIEH